MTSKNSNVYLVVSLLTLLSIDCVAQQLSPAQEYFTDISLLDQDGKQQRLYSDLMAGKVVVVSSFFTHCDSSCPVTVAKFSALQQVLGDRLGRDVHMLLLSNDPDRDTPSRLKTYADKFKANPGWYFLTGEQANIAAALHKFGQSTESPELHKNEIIVGNEATGLWQKATAIISPQDLLNLVEATLEDRLVADQG